MKSIWQRFKISVLFILSLIILIPLLVFSIGELNTPSGGYRIYTGQTSIPLFHYVDDSYPSSAISSTGACIFNGSGNDYFVPTRTLTEWLTFTNNLPSSVYPVISNCCGDKFCMGGETVTSCPTDCGYLCDYRPTGIYTSAIYSASTNCGHTPGCAFTYPAGQTPNPLPQVVATKEGGGCGVLQKTRYSQCASLLRPSFSICQGDPCINGLSHVNYGDPEFCVGYYDHPTKRCIYSTKVVKSIPNWGLSSYIDNYPSYQNGSYGFNTNPYFNGGALGSWGVCYTVAAPCGDGLCSAGESCSSCASDCGACPIVCGDYVCTYGYEDCNSCPTDCGTCDPVCGDWQCNYGETCSSCPNDCGTCNCSSYYDDWNCNQNGCTWDYGSSYCHDPISGCGSYSDYNSCSNAGCSFDWNYYVCRSYSCYNYYDQSSCEVQGCLWNYSYCYAP